RGPDALSERLLGDAAAAAFQAAGCGQCQHSGHAGRIGLYEAVRVDGVLRRLIVTNADEDALATAGFPRAVPLPVAARAAAPRRHTTLEEVLRVTRQESSDATPEPGHAVV